MIHGVTDAWKVLMIAMPCGDLKQHCSEITLRMQAGIAHQIDYICGTTRTH